MRFPVASIFFIVLGFVFAVAWAIVSRFLGAVKDALLPLSGVTGNASRTDLINLLPNVFAFLCLLMFAVGIVLAYFLEATSDDPEYYYKEDENL